MGAIVFRNRLDPDLGGGAQGGSIVFDMNYSAGAVPTAGWADVADIDGNEGSRFTQARAAGAGPSGQDAYLMTQLALGSPNAGNAFGGQFNWGWRGDIEPTVPGSGVSRFYRWRMKFSSDTNFHGLDWESGAQTGQQNKVLLVAFEGDRFIMTTRATRNNGFVFTMGLGGGAEEVESGSYSVNQWLDLQVELRAGTGNGLYRCWVNTNTQGSPTFENTGLTMGETDWNAAWFGGFMNDGLDSDGIYQWHHADFEVGTAFHAAWH